MNEAIGAVLSQGLDDWVQAVDVDWAAGKWLNPGSSGDRAKMCVEIVRELLKQGLVEIGDVTAEGFKTWKLGADDAVHEVERRWVALDEGGPRLGDVCWMRLTPLGRTRGLEAARKLYPGADL